ncbi:hypothetical protein LME05_13150 [Leuconostoc mesenteroides subsp. cremoris]|nr:hypothetical protein LME05_13150 [Leuconostoc mesenteroides subsp. cremoris]
MRTTKNTSGCGMANNSAAIRTIVSDCPAKINRTNPIIMVKIHQKNKLRRLSLSANFGNSETDSKPVTMFSEAKIEKADEFPKIKVK